MGDIADQLENRKRMNSLIDDRGILNVKGIYEAAAEAQAKRIEENRQAWDAKREKAAAEVQKQQDLFDKLAARIKAEQQEQADLDIKKEIAKATKEIEEKHYKEKNLKYETAKDKAYKDLLRGMKGE